MNNKSIIIGILAMLVQTTFIQGQKWFEDGIIIPPLSTTFSKRVAIEDTIAVVTAEKNNSYAGEVHVLKRQGGTWSIIASLSASDTHAGQEFGSDVAISGNVIVVGAPKDNANGTGSGAVYVFLKPADGWKNMTETAKLVPSDIEASDEFGHRVDISGSTIVAGARYDSLIKGAAYVFERPVTGWANTTESAKLTAKNGSKDEAFGVEVAIEGSTIAVGSHLDFDNGSDASSIYVFEKPLSGWVTANEDALLTISDGVANMYLGYSLDINGDNIISGAYGDDDNGAASGAVYVFEKGASEWTNMTETAKLTASEGTSNDNMGISVSMNDSMILAGAPGHDTLGSNSGAVYSYVKPESGWATSYEDTILTASNGGENFGFGQDVAISKMAVIFTKKTYSTGNTHGSIYLYNYAVYGPIKIKGSLENKTVAYPGYAYFNFEAENAKDYQWQISTNGVSYSDIVEGDPYTGTNTSTLKIKLDKNMSGNSFRCIVSNPDYAVASTIAQMTVVDGVAITREPESKIIDTTTAEVIFSVAGEYIKKYQWQVSPDGINYEDIQEAFGTPYSGSKTDSLRISTSDSLTGFKYRCIVSHDFDSDTTQAVQFNFAYETVITKEPVDQEVNSSITSVSFTVEGENITAYQWQKSTDGIDFTDIPEGGAYSGTQNGLLTITVNESMKGIKYRCKVSNARDEKFSNIVQLIFVTSLENKGANSVNSFQVYPVPAYDMVTILTNNEFSNDSRVTIYDISGMIIYQGILQGEEQQLDISSFHPGTYILSIESEKQLYIRRFIKLKTDID